jgi:HK97 family phage portal protein
MFDLSTLLPFRASTALTGPTSGFMEFGGGRQTRAGEPVSPTRALTLSAYFACIRVISEDVAKLPLDVYRRKKSAGKEHLPDHQLAKVLERPNPEMTGYTLRETVTQWAAGWGNGYAEIVRDGAGELVELWPIHPSRVRLFRQDGRLVYRVVSDPEQASVLPRGPAIDFRPEEIFHLRGMGTGILGYSIAQYGAETIGLALATEAFGAAFFGQGATSSGILTHPGALSEVARKNLRESWQATYGGSKNAQKVAIIEEGMTYAPISIPQDQAQFLETRKFQVEEICRWARVAPHKIQQLDHATFSNIEHQGREHVTDTLLPWLIRWVTEIRRQLITDPTLVVIHDADILMMGDTNARTNYYRTMVNIGAMSPDEVREMEGLNPTGGASAQHFMQTNMSTLDRIASGTAATSPPGTTSQATTDAPPAPPADDGAAAEAAERGAQLQAQVTALRPAFVAEADRVLRKEALAITRIAADPGKLAAFYDAQPADLLGALGPLTTALVCLTADVLGAEAREPGMQAFAAEWSGRAHQAVAAQRSAAGIPSDHTPQALADSVIALVLAAYPESSHVAA